MNFLSVEGLTKSYGDKMLFSDVTFGIDQGQKVALVAKNGSGKTTLLKCLMDAEPYDSGRVVYRKDISVVFMQQVDEFNPESSILEAVFDHDLPEIKAVKKYNEALLTGDEDLLNEVYQELTDLNAWDVEVKVSQILSVLKLNDSSLKVSQLSGGQKKRVALAKVLISEADFLILDEPTNHLDLDMIEWLEEYLSKSKSTILMVTHDRYFLEVVCDTILELADQTLYRYKGNFSYFLEKKAERQEQLQSTIDKAKNTFKKELEWIRKQPKARGTKQKARVENFQEVKNTASQRIQEDEMDIPVKMERLGTKILELHKVSKTFPDRVILDQLSYVFKRKERLGIVGNNGTGKSTFLNIIQELESIDAGSVVVGETVVFGYYNQDLIQVPDDKKVIDVIRDIAEYIPLEKGRQMSAAQFLEKFLFPRDMHYHFVHKLSGGEKRRLKMMTVLMKNPNFLILDEPTNDLDIVTLQTLEDFLEEFKGCVLIVSHDRYFIDRLVDHTFVMEGNGTIKDFPGNYTEYREWKANQKGEEFPVLKIEEPVIEKKAVEKTVTETPVKKLSYKTQRELELIEAALPKLEEKKLELETKLAEGITEYNEIQKISEELKSIAQELDEKSTRWLEIQEEV